MRTNRMKNYSSLKYLSAFVTILVITSYAGSKIMYQMSSTRLLAISPNSCTSLPLPKLQQQSIWNLPTRNITAKLLVYTNHPNSPQHYNQLLVAIKKVRGKKRSSDPRDGRYEFIGGRVDPGESPWEALIREIYEEEPSGILAKKLLQAQQEKTTLSGPSYLKISNQEEVALFFLCMPYRELKGVIEMSNSSEVYGYQLTSANQIRYKLSKKQKKLWTPKTLKILKHFRDKNLSDS
ncbi:MAG: NUDIX hydrolase [Zetaproteobacteria bacterium]|nr:NUDIX hydrolase [Zetaproteobacteria bacterium]